MTKYLICSYCGYRQGPYDDDTLFAGPAGQIGCPICTGLKINKNIEVYGNMEVVKVPLTLEHFIKLCGESANENGWVVKWDIEGKAKDSFPTHCSLTAHEILDAVDKGWRDDDKPKASEELGDGLVRIAHICHDLKIPMERILMKILADNKKRPYKHGRKVL